MAQDLDVRPVRAAAGPQVPTQPVFDPNAFTVVEGADPVQAAPGSQMVRGQQKIGRDFRAAAGPYGAP